MHKRLGTTLITAVLTLTVLGFTAACSREDQDKAHEQAAEARRKADDAAAKARVEAHKLAREARAQASNLDRNIKDAVNGTGSPQTGSDADAKLRRGGEDLKAAGNQAGVKLDHAALIAKVKTKLANDVGLSTVTGINVDARGDVVTLSGTVSTPEQKHQAEISAGQVSGVTRVVNNLQVQP